MVVSCGRGRRVAVATFPSYVAASSEDVVDDIPLELRLGGLGS